MMLEDEDFTDYIVHAIKYEKVNAEYTIMETGKNFSQMFSAMDEYMGERAADIENITNIPAVVCAPIPEQINGHTGEVTLNPRF